MATVSRYQSVDALRGLAVAAMLLVNNPGDWDHVFWPLEHAAWNGFTPTDLVFPMFLFIVGVSLQLATGVRLAGRVPAGELLPGLLVRALRIIALGLVLHLLAWWLMHKPSFRPMGVLQRIGLCFALASCVVVQWRSARAQWAGILVLLLGYGAMLLFGGDLSKAGNIASRLDTWLLGPLNYEWDAASGLGHDPEGLLSTLGALATTLLGVRAGALLQRGERSHLGLMAIACLALGALATLVWPWNKQLWTPSFALWAAGWSAAALLLAHQLVDRLRLPPLGRAFGVNAIAAYGGAWMCTVLLEGFGWMPPLYAGGFGWLGALAGPFVQSLGFALVFVLVWTLIVRLLDARRIYIKV